MINEVEDNFEQVEENDAEVSVELLNSLKEKLQSQKAEIDEKEDRLKRLMAEFENFKKRR